MSDRPALTTNFGQPVADNQNSLTAGLRGPVLMQDIHLVEKLAAGIAKKLEVSAY